MTSRSRPGRTPRAARRSAARDWTRARWWRFLCHEDSTEPLPAHPLPRGSGMTAVVELCAVSRIFPGSPPVLALQDVSLAIDHGELVAIVGPSGSGKSTMLHLMGTLDRPSGGRMLGDGDAVAELSHRALSALQARRIGFGIQQLCLPAGMPALANVADGLPYAGVPLRNRRARAADELDRVGLGNRHAHDPHQL